MLKCQCFGFKNTMQNTIENNHRRARWAFCILDSWKQKIQGFEKKTERVFYCNVVKYSGVSLNLVPSLSLKWMYEI